MYKNSKKRLHHHHLRPSHNKVLTIEKRVQVPQYQTNTQSQTQTNGWGQQPAAGFDYRKFFDFGFFANTAAGFGGPQPQQTHTVNVEKTAPQIVYEERVVPKVVYEKRIVPQVVVEKKIVPETIVVQKKVQPPAPITTAFTKEVHVEKRIESDVNANKEVNVAAVPAETQGSYAGGSSHSHFGFTGGVNQQTGSNIINDIFNIPIATLQAVNRLVSNKVSGAGNIDIQKTITVNHS